MIQFRRLLHQVTFFFIVMILLPSLLKGQTNANSPYIPSVIPPSPNAAALMKFTDVPVSLYTGTADISVPIYTIKAKGIELPVNLAYHTGGVKLKEEASSVGLGWALNAGGMISRTVMGHDDFVGQGNMYFTNVCPQLSGDISQAQPAQANQAPFISSYFFDFWCSYKVATLSGIEDFTPAFMSGSDTYDMEPDIFSYNFAGHSGKFILTRAGKVVLQKQENISIQFQGTGSQVTFKIIDDQGNTFYFNVLELSAVSPKPAEISSWLLSKVVTQQRDSIIFNYVSGGSTTSSIDETYQTYAAYCEEVAGASNATTPTPAYFNQTLQSIDFSNGHLKFAFDANRSDLQGSNKLDSIIIYSKNAAGTQVYVKQQNFNYSYFNANTSQSNLFEYYRLKLDSVKEISGGMSLPPYSFIYNNPDPGFGTAKHGYNIDHWGYYNAAANSGFIPTMDVGYSPLFNKIGFDQILHYSGANRQPNSAAMQTFSLQQITYPTGGKTMLTYQPNDYDYNNSLGIGSPAFKFVQTVSMDSGIVVTKHGYTSGTIDLRHIFPQIPEGLSGTNVTINIGFKYQSNNNFVYSNLVGKIYFQLGSVSLDINGATCHSGVPACGASSSLAVAPGVYNWTGYIDASIDTATVFSGIYVTVQYQETQQVYNLFQNNSYISPASGLRIQNITNYKDAGTIASKKVYTYNYMEDKDNTGVAQQYSYGRLMSIPSYARYGLTNTSTGGHCTALFLFSSSLYFLTSVIQGNIVGYDQVTETTVDPLTGQDIGKSVYRYFNFPDTAISYGGYGIPGTQNTGNNLNGELLSKVNYADNAGIYYKVDENDYYYHTTNRTVYYSPKYQYINSTGNPSDCLSGTFAARETLAWFYPSIKSEKVLIDSTKMIFYGQGDTTQAVVNTVANYYDNAAHYEVTRARSVDSKGNTLISLIKYPQDYIASGSTVTGNTILDSLIGRNMVSQAIEQRDSLYYPGSSAGYIRVAQLNLYQILPGNNNTIVPDRTFKLNIQSPIANFTPFSLTGNTLSLDSRNRQMVSFDKYDENNNLQQYTTTDQIPKSIIWDYNYFYPVAQVTNAVVADLAYTSFEADGKGNWSFVGTPVTDYNPPSGCKSYTLTAGNITKSTLSSSQSYVLSYWSRSGPQTVSNSVLTSTGKPVNGWIYYEYKITNASTVTVSGSGVIDELRLYPVGAQMTTYTYNPLIGMTSQCDVNNDITHYEYDALGRLKLIRDQNQNVLKKYCYNYAGQIESCSLAPVSVALTSVNPNLIAGFNATYTNVNTGATTVYNISSASSASQALTYVSGTTPLTSGNYTLTISKASNTTLYTFGSGCGSISTDGTSATFYNISINSSACNQLSLLNIP